MPTRKKTSRPVTSKQIAELLLDPQWVRDHEFEKRMTLPNIHHFYHPNGQLLVVPPQGNGRLHLSREALMHSYDNPRKPMSVLHGRLPQGETFITQVDDLVAQLPKLLKISSWQVDYSDEDLDKVTIAIKRVGKWRCLEVSIFPSLLAYVGEAIRIEVQGEWRMRLSEDGETWEPYIIAGEQAYNPFLWLIEDLEERSGIRLQSLVGLRIALGGVNPPGLGLPTPAIDPNMLPTLTLRQD